MVEIVKSAIRVMKIRLIVVNIYVILCKFRKYFVTLETKYKV